MSPAINATHVPEPQSWVESANLPDCDFPIQNLPFGRFRTAAEAGWSSAQLVAHHTVNSSNLSNGDLFGTGTLSGHEPEQGGSLLELKLGGKQVITLSNGQTRTFLEDGDTIILRGHCVRDGLRRIGLGECRGTVLEARAL